MGAVMNLRGMIFGRLTAVKKTGKKCKSKSRIWVCQCTCGKLTRVSAINLRTSRIRSCGCALLETRYRFEIGWIQRVVAWLDPLGRGAMELRGLIWMDQRRCHGPMLRPEVAAMRAMSELNTIRRTAPWAIHAQDYDSMRSFLGRVANRAPRYRIFGKRAEMLRIARSLKDVNRMITNKCVAGLSKWEDIAAAVEAEMYATGLRQVDL